MEEGGSADASVILIQNLEKKLFKKFEFIDDKIRKTEEESYRYKNEFSNNKIQIENINKAINLLKEENERHTNNGALLKELINRKYSELDLKLNDLDNHISSSILKQINELKDYQQSQINKAFEENKILKEMENTDEEDNNKKGEQPNTIGISEGEMKMVKDCIKKTIEFEKNFKVFVNSVNIDHIKAELAKMHEALATKLGPNDLLGIKETLCKLIS